MLLLLRCGAALDSRLCPAEGGVRGREFDPEMFLDSLAEALQLAHKRTYMELKFSKSACEYDAPTIFLLWTPLRMF